MLKSERLVHHQDGISPTLLHGRKSWLDIAEGIDRFEIEGYAQSPPCRSQFPLVYRIGGIPQISNDSHTRYSRVRLLEQLQGFGDIVRRECGDSRDIASWPGRLATRPSPIGSAV